MPNIPTIIVAAEKMRPEADSFRIDFVKNYLTTGKDYPIGAIFRTSSSLWPNSQGALKLLLQRDAIKIKGNTLSNATGVPLEARFSPVLNGTPFEVAVQIPLPFHATVSTSDTDLTLNLDTPFGITFVTKPAIPNSTMIPDQSILMQVTVSTAGLSYTFGDPDTNAPEMVIFLSFASVQMLGNELRTDAQLPHIERVMKRLAASAYLMDGGICGFLADDDYYVICDNSEHLTNVHHGKVVVGGQLEYTTLYGPDTYDNCNEWMNENYPDLTC